MLLRDTDLSNALRDGVVYPAVGAWRFVAGRNDVDQLGQHWDDVLTCLSLNEIHIPIPADANIHLPWVSIDSLISSNFFKFACNSSTTEFVTFFADSPSKCWSLSSVLDMFAAGSSASVIVMIHTRNHTRCRYIRPKEAWLPSHDASTSVCVLSVMPTVASSAEVVADEGVDVAAGLEMVTFLPEAIAS